jgi:hypothetical protein
MKEVQAFLKQELALNASNLNIHLKVIINESLHFPMTYACAIVKNISAGLAADALAAISSDYSSDSNRASKYAGLSSDSNRASKSTGLSSDSNRASKSTGPDSNRASKSAGPDSNRASKSTGLSSDSNRASKSTGLSSDSNRASKSTGPDSNRASKSTGLSSDSNRASKSTGPDSNRASKSLFSQDPHILGMKLFQPILANFHEQLCPNFLTFDGLMNGLCYYNEDLKKFCQDTKTEIFGNFKQMQKSMLDSFIPSTMTREQCGFPSRTLFKSIYDQYNCAILRGQLCELESKGHLPKHLAIIVYSINGLDGRQQTVCA